MKISRKIIIGAASVFFVGIVLSVMLYRSLFRYELTLTEKGTAIQIHTLQLGEYCTPVKELTIKDANQLIVMRLIAKGENSRLHTITFQTGQNSSFDMYIDEYNIEGVNFRFQRNQEYTASASWSSGSASMPFSLK